MENIQKQVNLGDILSNINSAILNFEGETDRYPIKAFIGNKLLKLLEEEDILNKAGEINLRNAEGIYFYDKRLLCKEKINKEHYNELISIDDEFALILTANGLTGRLKYALYYNINIPKDSHIQAY